MKHNKSKSWLLDRQVSAKWLLSGHMSAQYVLCVSTVCAVQTVSLVPSSSCARLPKSSLVPPLLLTTPLDDKGWVLGGDVVRVGGSGGLTDHN